MTVEEYLKDHCKVDLGYIAQKMWPTNKAAKSYLSKKLNKRDGRIFTKEDAANALKVLSEEVITDLKTEFGKLTIE